MVTRTHFKAMRKIPAKSGDKATEFLLKPYTHDK